MTRSVPVFGTAAGSGPAARTILSVNFVATVSNLAYPARKHEKIIMTSHKAKVHEEDAITPVRRSIFEQLRQEILTGKLNDGERLVETDIAQRLKVSRTPVREALRKLEIEGLVEYSPGRGVTVAKISPGDMDELYAIRGVLEGLCARLAAAHITESKIATLKKLLQQMNECYEIEDYRSVTRFHTQFDELVARASRSPRVQEMSERYREYTERHQLRSIQLLPKRFSAVMKEHQAIVEALEQRQARAAEEAVRYHVEQARNAYFKTLEQWGPWLVPERPRITAGREKKHSGEREF